MSTADGASGVFTVVVGVSATSGSPTALAWAAGEARHRGGRVVALQAWRPPRPASSIGARPPLVTPDVDQSWADAREQLLENVVSVLGSDSAVECRMVEGGRRKALLEASATADLLVIDAPRRTDLRSSPLLARRIVYKALCPVVIMPPALAGQPDTAVVAAGKQVGRSILDAAGTAGRPGVRPPAIRPAGE